MSKEVEATFTEVNQKMQEIRLNSGLTAEDYKRLFPVAMKELGKDIVETPSMRYGLIGCIAASTIIPQPLNFYVLVVSSCSIFYGMGQNSKKNK